MTEVRYEGRDLEAMGFAVNYHHRYMIPWSRRLESWSGPQFGKSVVLVAERR